MEYWSKFLKNEFAHDLFYMVPFLLFSNLRGFVYYVPLMIHFWVGFCEYLKLTKNKLFYNRAKELVEKTTNGKVRLLILKSKIEVFEIPYFMVCALIWNQIWT